MALFDFDELGSLGPVDRQTVKLVGEAAALAAMKLLQGAYSQKDAADIALDIEAVARKVVARRLRQK
jgi:hypothetical protein